MYGVFTEEDIPLGIGARSRREQLGPVSQLAGFNLGPAAVQGRLKDRIIQPPLRYPRPGQGQLLGRFRVVLPSDQQVHGILLGQRQAGCQLFAAKPSRKYPTGGHWISVKRLNERFEQVLT